MKITYSENNSGTGETLAVYDFLVGINQTMEGRSGRVEGEVTSVKATYATAIYFTIKDTKREALLNCVIWRSVYNQNGVVLKEGDTIIVTGTPEIYLQRGSFSLKVQTIEYAGAGALKKSYDELRLKLTREGLLSPDLKRVLPKFPEKIGVITSRSGVVIQDFSSNLGRYGFRITMVDSRVEGKDAIHELLAALETLANQDIEVLVIMRGGGSSESLQAFNTESVVRAIAGFKCPVLTGIGHDVDVTLAELVADVGASTPTAVAERLNESWDTVTSSLETVQARILSAYQLELLSKVRTVEGSSSTILRRFDQVLSSIDKTLVTHSEIVRCFFRNLENRTLRVHSAFLSVVGSMKSEVRSHNRRLDALPQVIIGHLGRGLVGVHKRIEESSLAVLSLERSGVQRLREILVMVEKRIRLSDPERNLKLGYSLSYAHGRLLRSTKDVLAGDEIEVRLGDGSFTSEVKNVQ